MGCGHSSHANKHDLILVDDSSSPTLMTSTDELKFKVVLLGNKSVGKSCIVSRATKNEFNATHQLTIGAAFSAKTIPVRTRSGQGSVKLHIWDTAGEELYRSMTVSFFRGAAAGLVVYSIDDRNSFEQLTSWIRSFREYNPDSLIYIVGNKSDLEAERKVSPEEVANLIEALRPSVISANGGVFQRECCAKSGENVQNIFGDVAQWLVNRAQNLPNS